MRYQTYDNGGAIEGLVSISGMNLTGFLTMRGDPVAPLEIATRQYVLTKATAIKASSIVSGVFSKGRMPPMTGAVTTVQGNTLLTIQPSGVLPGTYTKVTVNSAGQVTSGGQLLVSDIPPLSWSKITSGKPNTLEGYGITDGVNRNTGILALPLTLASAPTEDTDVATKLYVDQKGGIEDIYRVGDLIKGDYSAAPTGFLRCNGAEVSKTTYANLFNILTDKFGNNITPGAGRPWERQVLINNDWNGAINNWTAGSNLPVGLAGSSAVVTKNRVYLIGGTTTIGSTITTTYTAYINDDGTISNWVTGPSLPAGVANAQIFITKNRVYVVGGYSGSAFLSVVYQSGINPDGTLIGWTTETSLPGVTGIAASVVTEDRVYIIGGATAPGTYTSTIYTATFGANGILGTWGTTTAFPIPIGGAQVVVTRNRVYVYGGANATGYLTTAYCAAMNANGTLGTWTSVTGLPAITASAQVYTTKNRAYIFGGATSLTARVSRIYTAPINADGTIGTWITQGNLPFANCWAQSFTTSSRFYYLGGETNNDTTYNSVYFQEITGGVNDCSPFYDGTFVNTSDSTKFCLPNYTLKENPSGNIFIKY